MTTIIRTEQFLSALDNVEFTDTESYRKMINRLCKNELAYLRKNVELTTLRRYRTDYRNAIRDHYKGKNLFMTYTDKKKNNETTHIALKYFTLKKSEIQQYNSYEEHRKDAYLNVSNDNRLVIIDHNELINTATDLLSSNSDHEVVAGLLALTGRRTVEIWKTGHFEYIDDNQVLFTGQAKTRNSPNARHFYQIFTLCDAQLVCSALARLRANRDLTNKTEREVNSITSNYLSKVVKRHFNRFIMRKENSGFLSDYGFIEAKDLRAMYVHIAQTVFLPNSLITKFADEALGHVCAKGANSDNYMIFRLKNDTDKIY